MKEKFFKVWDIVILILILTSIYFIFHFYVEFTPVQVEQSDKINLYITIVFIIDVILRILLLKKEYIKSTDIIIDVLACLDIFGPVLKVFRLTKFARLIRITKLFRIFRTLKVIRFLELPDNAKKIFNYTGILSLLIFIFLGNTISTSVQKEFKDSYKRNYTTILNTIVHNSRVADTFDSDYFLNSISKFKNLIAVKIDSLNYFRQYKDNEYIKKNFFKDDRVVISTNNITLVLVAKNITFLSKKIEYYSIISAIIFYFLFLVIIYIVFKKEHSQWAIEEEEKKE